MKNRKEQINEIMKEKASRKKIVFAHDGVFEYEGAVISKNQVDKMGNYKIIHFKTIDKTDKETEK